jgi:hypothetical protein
MRNAAGSQEFTPPFFDSVVQSSVAILRAHRCFIRGEKTDRLFVVAPVSFTVMAQVFTLALGGATVTVRGRGRAGSPTGFTPEIPDVEK